MPIMYGKMNVDERYAPTFEPNLYLDTWLIPNITYTDKYQIGPAGAVYVHKYKKATAITPGTPGRDFEHKLAEDELIPILMNNNFMTSRKLYGVQINAIEANAAEALVADTTALVREGIASSAIASLVTEGTALTDKTEITEINVRATLLAAQAELAGKGASSATTALVSPTVYAHLMASMVGGYTPTANDEVVKTGVIRNYFGFDAIIRCPHLKAGSNVAYYNYAGTSKTVTSATLGLTDFIIMNPQAFSVINNLEVYRIVDGGKDFNGILAQAEVNTGYRVTNADLVYVHSHTA